MSEKKGGDDVEMNASKTEDSEMITAGKAEVPTIAEIVYDFNGSLGFAVGSSGFIVAMYLPNWLPHFRYGSLFWIWGCVAYTIPLLLKLKDGRAASEKNRCCACPWGIGDTGEFFCYLFYTIGCILGGFFDEEAVERYFNAINHMFIYGSFSLAVEPVYQVFLFLVRDGSCGSRMRATKLCGSGSLSSRSNDDDKNDAAVVTAQQPLRLNLDRFLELMAMIFFCAAGLFGGFPFHPSVALPGVYCWEVGSLFSVARSCKMVYDRKQGLLNAEARGTMVTQAS